jgi:hypothetical protein
MPKSDAAAAGQVCPGIRIHAIDIVQPPGIGIPPIADMDVHQTINTRRTRSEEQRGDGPKRSLRGLPGAMRREITSPAIW